MLETPHSRHLTTLVNHAGTTCSTFPTKGRIPSPRTPPPPLITVLIMEALCVMMACSYVAFFLYAVLCFTGLIVWACHFVDDHSSEVVVPPGMIYAASFLCFVVNILFFVWQTYIYFSGSSRLLLLRNKDDEKARSPRLSPRSAQLATLMSTCGITLHAPRRGSTANRGLDTAATTQTPTRRSAR